VVVVQHDATETRSPASTDPKGSSGKNTPRIRHFSHRFSPLASTICRRVFGPRCDDFIRVIRGPFFFVSLAYFVAPLVSGKEKPARRVIEPTPT